MGITVGRAVAGAALICAVGVAACGGASNSTGESSATAASGSKTAGPPIKLMVLGPVQAPQFSIPELPYGAEAAAKEINAQGGVAGREIVVDICNDKNDPNEAAKCARQAVADKVAAVVGGYTSYEAQVMPVLERAGIPWVGPTPISNFTSPSYFIIGSDPASGFFGVARAMVDRGCRHPAGMAEDFAGGRQAEKLWELGVAAAKGAAVKPIFAPQNAPDWGPAVASAVNEGATCLGMVSNPATAAKIITAAAQSGKQLRLGSISQIIPGTVIAQLGKAADGVMSASAFPPFGSGQPGLANLEQEVKAINPKVVLDDFVPLSYASVKVVAEAAKALPTVDSASLMSALPKVKDFDTGLGVTLSLDKPNPAQPFSRVFNTKVYPLVAKGGRFTLASKSQIDTLSAFQIAAAAQKK